MSLPILDVAIGISFVYLLLALICTTVNEMIAGWMKTRARFLDHGITRLLNGDDQLKRKIYDHPLIRSLSTSDTSVCPSYIPGSTFATVLMDVLSGSQNPHTNLDAVREGVETEAQKSKKALSVLFADPDADPAAMRARIEQWFDLGMDRVSGWYKRHTQVYNLILASGITLLLNADTLHIASMLWVSPTTRAALVEEAKVRSEKARPEELLPLVEYPNSQDATASEPVNLPLQALSDKEQELLGQLTGWNEDWKRWRDIPGQGFLLFITWFGGVICRHTIGWILTAIAVSIGAPFWFDTLNRFMNIRSAGRAPDERRDKSSSTAAAAPEGAVRG